MTSGKKNINKTKKMNNIAYFLFEFKATFKNGKNEPVDIYYIFLFGSDKMDKLIKYTLNRIKSKGAIGIIEKQTLILGHPENYNPTTDDKEDIKAETENEDLYYWADVEIIQ